MELGALRTATYPLCELNLGNSVRGKPEPDAKKDRFLLKCMLTDGLEMLVIDRVLWNPAFDHEYFF